MVQQEIILSYKVSKKGIEVERAMVDLTSNLTPPTSMKQIRFFLCHVGFYRSFIKDFRKLAWPLTNLLAKETSFDFDESYIEAFENIRSLLV